MVAPELAQTTEERVVIAGYVLEMLEPVCEDGWQRGDEPPCGPDYDQVPEFSRHPVWG